MILANVAAQRLLFAAQMDPSRLTVSTCASVPGVLSQLPFLGYFTGHHDSHELLQVHTAGDAPSCTQSERPNPYLTLQRRSHVRERTGETEVGQAAQ